MPALQNLRILVTRTRHQASGLAAQLEALGATPILIPTIEIVPPESYAPLDAALAQLETRVGESYDWLVFTSANAVEIFHQRRQNLRQLQGPVGSHRDFQARVSASPEHPSPKIAAIGPATARAVQGIGLQADLVPSRYVAEGLAEALIAEAPGKRILLVRACEARDILPEALAAAGVTVTIADAYRNQIPPGSVSALQQLFSSPVYPDAITFTSSSTARNLFTLLDVAAVKLPASVTLASIGPVTSQTLRDLGYPPQLEAAEPTITGLVQSLTTHFQ